jgi:EAL domain-containing protein (putative c-di-GMP-specific phosphodiesterase class I)
MSKLAIVIGVTDCHANLISLPSAHKDVKAIKQVLEDPHSAAFDRVEPLFNPDIAMMQRTIGKTFAQCQPEDLVLLYFSGHGLRSEEGELYFVAQDTEPDLLETAISAQSIQKTLNRCPAQRQIVILDCCFSGVFADSWLEKGNYAILQAQLGAEGRVVLMSSDSSELSWGSREGLSLYTQHLVEGIAGEADREGFGEIRIRQLHQYVLDKVQLVGSDLRPQILVQSEAYDIILSQRSQKMIDHSNVAQNAIKSYQKKDGSTPFSQNNAFPLISLPNILTPFSQYIQAIIQSLESHGAFGLRDRSNHEIHQLKLAVLQDITGAENIVLWQGETYEFIQPVLQSNLAGDNGSETLRNLVNQEVARIFTPNICGLQLPNNAGMLVPVETQPSLRFLALHGISSIVMQEPVACLISAFYHLDEAQLGNPVQVESALIDAWKRRFEFMPSELYDRRFELFCQRLRTMEVSFQPILQLKPLMLSGWEALARDRARDTAPLDLFKVAELWGRQFLIELDVYFLDRAARTYQAQTLKYGLAPLPLSINVYPDSLLHRNYQICLNRLVSSGMIDSRNLVLEISEKREIAYVPTWHNSSPNNDAFRNCLKGIATQNPNIQFAIDDYGSNYATVSRLLGLRLNYVKVDREILYCEPDARRSVLRFIQNLMIEQGYFQPHIVMEGIDEDCPMELWELGNLGISHVQGFTIGKPQAEIYGELSAELRDYLQQQLDPPINPLPTF